MSVTSWIASSLDRHFPQSPARRGAALTLESAMNESVSFQIGVRAMSGDPQTVTVEVRPPDGWSARVRRVGYVPVLHHNTLASGSPGDVIEAGRIPGFVPDPLFDEQTVKLSEGETHAFWVTLKPNRECRPGRHSVRIRVCPEQGKATSHKVSLLVHDTVLAARRDFRVTHWFYVDALIDWYGTDLFDKQFWTVLPRYVRDIAEHGQDTLYVPVFTPPLDGVKRPSQLLRVKKRDGGRYEFDWRDVRRYTQLARRCGITHFEWCHPFTQWGARNAIRVYENQGADERLLWRPSTSATSKVYRGFLSQYLPSLRRFLESERLVNRSYFHVSDEPHGTEHLVNYRKARALLRELAPWMQVMDALSEIDFARQKLTDMPIPSIQVADNFVDEDIPCWCYYCCGPRGAYLNRLLDTPLAKIAMHGFLFYRLPFKGFLHWGYNYWYKRQSRDMIDPYTGQDGGAWPGWAYGDPFVVYPGPDGPVDSMRWEILAEALQDYRLLQTAQVDRTDPMLRACRNFEDFPKSAAWRTRARHALLTTAAHRTP